MGKQRAIRLNLNRTFDEKNFPTGTGKIYDEKEEVNYEPICVFTENKSRWKFWKGARNLIFFVDGALHALKFKEKTDDLNPYWSKKEARLFVYKMIMKALQEFKPIKMWQFIILLIPNIIILFVLIRIASVIGAI